MNDKIKKAVDTSQRAQRNYDLSKNIEDKDLETLIYAATHSPSKQNETHYSLHVYTDRDIIREIYNTTKRFTFGNKQHLSEILDPTKGEQWMYENRAVHNSQILANALFVYTDDDGPMRGVTHFLAQNDDQGSIAIYNEQKNYSIGISVGQLTLAATLLNYKTGICSAFDQTIVRNIIKSDRDVKLLVGVGYENTGVDRRLHAETLNREITEEYQTGNLDEKWRFPSLDKTIKVSINGK